MDERNTFPQNLRINRGAWRDFEAYLIAIQKNYPKTIVIYKLNYANQYKYIPTKISATAHFFDDSDKEACRITETKSNFITPNPASDLT